MEENRLLVNWKSTDIVPTPSGPSSTASSVYNAPSSRFSASPVEFNRANACVVPYFSQVSAVVTVPCPMVEGGYEEVAQNPTVNAQEEGTLTVPKRSPRRKPPKKIKYPAPVVDLDYFDSEYKLSCVNFWKLPFDMDQVLPYLNDGKETDRGKAYIKFAPILHQLQCAYLSPDDFVKYDKVLYKWRYSHDMSTYNGMKNHFRNMSSSTVPDNDWLIPEGARFTMYLWEKNPNNKKNSWNAWYYIKQSEIENGGNGLFSAREFDTGQTLGFYVGNPVYRYPKKWTKKATDNYLEQMNANLEDDSRTMSLVDKQGYRVLVNPNYTRGRIKIEDPPLLMGIHYLNDFSKVYQAGTAQEVKDEADKFNNVWVDDQGAVKALSRIPPDKELFLSYEGRVPLSREYKPRQMSESDGEKKPEAKPCPSTAATTKASSKRKRKEVTKKSGE